MLNLSIWETTVNILPQCTRHSKVAIFSFELHNFQDLNLLIFQRICIVMRFLLLRWTSSQFDNDLIINIRRRQNTVLTVWTHFWSSRNRTKMEISSVYVWLQDWCRSLLPLFLLYRFCSWRFFRKEREKCQKVFLVSFYNETKTIFREDISVFTIFSYQNFNKTSIILQFWYYIQLYWIWYSTFQRHSIQSFAVKRDKIYCTVLPIVPKYLLVYQI